MKRKFTLLIAALALLTMIVQPGRAWADEASFAPSDFSGQGTSGTGSAISATVSGVTFACNKGYGTTQIRCYSGGKITISSDNTITAISFTFSSSYTGGLSTSYTDLSTTSWVQTLSSQARITACTVTYTAGGGDTPSLSVTPTAIEFGSKEINPDEPYTETFTVTYANLSENLTVSVGEGLTGISVSPQQISKDGDGSQVVTVSYNPTSEGEISGNITVSNTEDDLSKTVAVSGSSYDPANVVIYERYTGAIVEGDYIICANAEVAMKNEISSSRFANESITVSDNKITNPDASIIWHIAADGDHWTIYNATVDKYAGGTTSNNQGALLDEITDYSRWDITYASSSYTVTCYGRDTSNNKYLRRNGTYGWATYGNSTGNPPTFYKKAGATTYSVTYNANGATSGSVPTDSNEYESGAEVTVLGNTGTLAKAGYVWAGWNTKADGTGTDRAEGSKFNISENTTLYAKWDAKTITTLTYSGTPTATQYAGQAFNPAGLTVTATFNDESQEDVTSQVVWTPNSLTIETTSVTGTYMGLSVVVEGITVTYAPGTQDNPYTVAQARAAIDAGTGVINVYATGIVSEIVTPYNSQYGNISYNISTDGLTTSDQLQSYRGKSYNGENFTSDDDIQVGDIVVVYGNLKKYNDIYEFDANNQLVSLIRKVANPTFSPMAGAVAAGTEVTIACVTTGATIYYTTDGTDPTISSSVYSEPIVVNAAMTIKAFAWKDGSPSSDIVTAEYTIAAPVATPTFSVSEGTYNFAQSVEIECTTEGATIYYTTDGNDPTTESTKYTEAIVVNETMTIKAIGAKAGLANSEVASATYTMNIPVINASNVNLAYDATNGSIAYTLTNEVEGGVLTAVRTEGDWLTVGEVSAESVALTCTANEGEADRTATVTLTYNYETHTVTKVVTVTQAHFIIDYAKLPFEFNGGKADIETTVGLTQNGLGSNYSSSPKLKFDDTGDWVILKINETPGKLTFDIKNNSFSGGTFTVQTSEDGATYTDLENYTTITGTQNEEFDNLGENVRYIKWIYTNKSSGNVGLGNIALAKYTEPVPSISAEDVAVAYDATSGSIMYTINNYVAGTMVATTEADWISDFTCNQVDEIGEVGFTTAANTGAERSATVTLTYTYDNSKATVTKDVTVTQNGTPSITVTPATANVAFAGGTPEFAVTYESLEITKADDFDVKFYETPTSTTAGNQPSWITNVAITGNTTDGFTLTVTVAANDGDARDAYLKVYAAGSNDYIYSNLVTINQAAFVQLTTYSLVTSVDQIVSGKHYLFVGYKGEVAYAMGYDKGNNRNAVEVTVDNNTIPETVGAYEFVINNSGEDWTIYDNNVQELNTNDTYGFLYAAGGTSNNYLKTRTTNNDDKGIWTITIDDETHVASITAKSTGRNKMRFNDGNSPLFSCYSNGQKDIYLYVKDNDNNYEYYGMKISYEGTSIPDGETITVGAGSVMTVTNYFGNDNPAALVIEDGGQVIVSNSGVQATFKKSVSHSAAKDANNWYTISSPVNNITPSAVTNLIQTPADNYDLYYYDEENVMWKNHKKAAITNLTNGKGYLYWNAGGDELSFPGELNSGNIEIALTKTGTGDLAGWNLIGNPYSHNIYKGAGTAIVNSVSEGYELTTGFYTLANSGAWVPGTDNTTAIVPGQGILVKATTAGTLTMTNTNSSGTAKANNDNIQFIVSNSEYEDITYALFNTGIGLDKINHRNAEIPMVYIPQNGQNYAIATMSDDTEMFNLNFKAMTTGQYTLRVDTKGNYSYLHIYDKMTNEDVDMLLEGEYSFIGSPRDAEDRFVVRLSYRATIDGNDTNIFAYQSGSDIIVNGKGELQVFDVNGRMVMNTVINGKQTVNIPTTGLYIFRMVGESVKTQKIVVR